MTPVINPWFFYLISLADKVFYVSVAAVITLTIAIPCTCLASMEAFDEDWWKKAKTAVRSMIAGLVTAALLLVFSPTSNTIVKMLIAQNVTYERVEMVGDTVQSVYEDIMELFDKEDDDHE